MYRSLTEGSALRYSSSLIARIFEWYSSKDHNSDRVEKVKRMKFRNSKELLCVGFEQRSSLRQYSRLLVLVRRSNSSTCRHDELLNHAPSLLQYPTKHLTTSAVCSDSAYLAIWQFEFSFGAASYEHRWINKYSELQVSCPRRYNQKSLNYNHMDETKDVIF